MRVLDAFCGAAGGWSVGLHRAGYRTVAAAEVDPWRREVFLASFPGVEMFEDVRDVSARSVRERLGYLPEVVVGSPPCQDISTAANNAKPRGVDGERSGLFFEAVRIIAEVRPAWAALENSPALRARGADRVLDDLEGAGYAVWPLVVGAWHAGAPHRRNRAWLVAVRDDAADAYRDGEPHPAFHAEVARASEPAGAAAAADAHGAGLWHQPGRRGGPGWAEGAAEPEHHWQELWHRWNGGWAAHAGGVDDGLPQGLARRCLSAYGDSVCPIIPEALGRVMARLLAGAA